MLSAAAHENRSSSYPVEVPGLAICGQNDKISILLFGSVQFLIEFLIALGMAAGR